MPLTPTTFPTNRIAGAAGHVEDHNALGLAVNALSGAAVGESLPNDGTTDIAPYIQAAYDAGLTTITLRPNTVYQWNSAVFVDKTDAHRGLTINGNKATIQLGAGLPTSSWSRDTSTQFAIFPNTNRTALSGGVVTVTDATRSTGTNNGAIRSLVVRDVTIDGQALYRGFSFANRTGCTFENVIFYRGRVLQTWWDYPDQQIFIGCYSRGGSGPTEQVLAEQYNQGDGLLFIGGKADSSVGLARLKTCRGAHFAGIVTGSIELDNCTGIVITGAHMEGQQSTKTMLTVKASHVVVEGGAWYENWSATVPTISIDDTGSTESASELTLRNVVAQQLVTGSTVSTQFSPLVNVVGSADNTRIVFDNVKGMHTSTGIAGSWVDSRQPYITGTTPVTAVLATPKGQAALASGSFVLRRLSSTVGWTIDTLHQDLYVSSRVDTRPLITQISLATGFSGGTLTSGTVYAYAVAVMDAQGNYSQASTETTATATSTGMARILLNLADGPQTLVVWRKTTAGVLTAPDRYAVMTSRSSRVYLYDTGDYIGGLPWVTTSVPVPNTVAATNNTVAALILSGTVITS